MNTIKQLPTSAYRHPSLDLCVIGVTGTNGKTTVAHLIGEVLKSAGLNPFILGTLNSGNKDLSTPEAADIYRFMCDHRDNGGTHFVMEVTSEGIDQGRISDVDFDIKILTNITQDHLDYHKTFANYEAVKLSFMGQGTAHKIFPKNYQKEAIDFIPALLGVFNLANTKAAISALRHLHISNDIINKTLSSCSAPRGRLESVNIGQPYQVFIDYAHTPDALENVLSTAKEIASNQDSRLLVLLGCGGNRDAGKRPKMGKIASALADVLVITDDNPRDEDSQTIIQHIVSGIASDFKNTLIISDRRAAIEAMVSEAREGDVLILAGKGHETYQISKNKTLYFDDREEIINSINKKKTCNNKP
ncbi:MAG: UDP-N-acetylmuramoyl-L-alanyl-D-glutamate--2,6-diaminopimelate ligase [Pseudomonadales bacterium]|nr:UDP-N-acetylmuramoyl-L-alanyl-D-glutamate--2,6-diaminopimelate ligase [Pseudomonadales bacterium]